VARLRPQLKVELDKRIMASADLIRLNRDGIIAKTLQRFSGWATSIPLGGSAKTNKREDFAAVRRGVAGLPFEERRVLVDQGHKLASSINEVAAVGGGAIAVVWKSHYNQQNYDYR